MTKVLIATTAYSGSVTVEYMVSLAETVALGLANDVYFTPLSAPGLCLVQHARDGMTKTFLDSDFDHILWIDEDVAWDAKDAIDVIRRPEDVVGIALPRKIAEDAYAIRPPSDDGGRIVWSEDNQVFKVDGLATGFLKTSRACLQKMYDAASPYTFSDGSEHKAVFEMKIVGGVFWGEDYLFCQRWRDTGGDVWLYPWADLRHVGKKVWQGSYVSWLNSNGKNE